MSRLIGSPTSTGRIVRMNFQKGLSAVAESCSALFGDYATVEFLGELPDTWPRVEISRPGHDLKVVVWDNAPYSVIADGLEWEARPTKSSSPEDHAAAVVGFILRHGVRSFRHRPFGVLYLSGPDDVVAKEAKTRRPLTRIDGWLSQDSDLPDELGDPAFYLSCVRYGLRS